MSNWRYGVALAEILMGITILAVTFLALIQVFPTAYSAADQSGDVLTATHLAQGYMDREMARNYDNLTNLPVASETLLSDSAGAKVVRNYSVSVQVRQLDAERRRIVVSVQWKQRSQDLPRELRLESTRIRP